MRSPIRAGLVGLAALLLAACGTPAASVPSTGTPSATASPPATADATGSPAGQPSEAPTTEPIPSDELGAFGCDLPVVEGASAPIANIVDVRIGEHDGYDRVVLEFEQGTPELTLDRATPPFAQEGSGFPLEVEGSSFLRLTMRGGTKQTDEGTSSYDGPTEFDAGLTALVHLIEGGDFERQSTWYFGLADEACVRVLLLDEPHRLVIDVEH